MDMQINYYAEETTLVVRLFNFEAVMDFQLAHDVQIIREADLQYMCYIDGEGYGSALTTMGALVLGIEQYNSRCHCKELTGTIYSSASGFDTKLCGKCVKLKR